MAAHDLAAPLAAIRMHVHAMERQARSSRPPTADDWREAMGRVDRLVGNAQLMLDDVLAVERLEEHPAPGPSSAFPLVDAEKVLADVIVMQAGAIERVGCSIFVKRRDDLSRVHGRWNRSSLERLFSNLIQNVVRHAPGAPIEISFARREEILQIHFADGGPGLPVDKLRVGGEAFVESMLPDTGHGLGLWIVYRIVAEMGGQITMQSAAGKGLSFDIRLPFAST
jgi:signal transduction histidine kinase